MQLAPDRVAPTQEALLEQLRALILAGRAAPGAVIPVDAVAARFSVSRIPVREALATLVAEGLVAHEPRGAYVVARVTRQELAELYLVRASLEAAALTAVRATRRRRRGCAGRAHDLAARYGVRDSCRAVRAVDLPVLALESDPGAFDALLLECTAAVADGCDVIVLGCAAMAPLATALTGRLGVPVVDGVAAAVGAAQGLVRMGLTTAKHGEYATPPPKPHRGLLHPFAPAPA